MRSAASTCTPRGCGASSSPPTHRCRRGCGEHPKITIVRSEEFFADTSQLPTHNSHAVEAQLHRIPGIAEHFLYSNDDMFFGRLVEPELFFTAGGVSKFVECEVRIGAGPATTARSGHDNALRVNRELLRSRFGRTIIRDLEHCATPLRRSVMAEMEQVFADDFARTAASRFRSATDISVTNSLYHYYALMTGPGRHDQAPQGALRPDDAGRVAAPHGATGRAAPTSTCSASTTAGRPRSPRRCGCSALRAALERMFPVQAPWERDELSEARRSARSAHPSARR